MLHKCLIHCWVPDGYWIWWSKSELWDLRWDWVCSKCKRCHIWCHPCWFIRSSWTCRSSIREGARFTLVFRSTLLPKTVYKVVHWDSHFLCRLCLQLLPWKTIHFNMISPTYESLCGFQPFFEQMYRALKPGGVVCTQVSTKSELCWIFCKVAHGHKVVYMVCALWLLGRKFVASFGHNSWAGINVQRHFPWWKRGLWIYICSNISKVSDLQMYAYLTNNWADMFVRNGLLSKTLVFFSGQIGFMLCIKSDGTGPRDPRQPARPPPSNGKTKLK